MKNDLIPEEISEITLTKQDLHKILMKYDEDEYNAKPLNVKSFVDTIFDDVQKESEAECPPNQNS